jgi:hypothetical protein
MREMSMEREDGMFTVIVETRKDGEKATGEEAFLARVEAGEDGGIRHQFGLEVVDYNNRRAFAMLAEPGQVFTTCRWRLDGETFVGGQSWFTISAAGAVYPLEEKEALALLAMPGAAGPEPCGLPACLTEQRAPPADIFCRRNDIIPEAPPGRPLD